VFGYGINLFYVSGGISLFYVSGGFVVVWCTAFYTCVGDAYNGRGRVGIMANV
jgi:hypothetical protein